MQAITRATLILAACAALSLPVRADEYDKTINVFRNAGQSSVFFDKSYGYAVFPTIGKGGLGLGAAHGKGRVYQGNQYVGDTSMTEVSLGLQIGGQAFSQIIFFRDQRAFDEFTSGHFEFGAGAGAVAVTAAAQSSAGTTGANASASGGKNDAATAGGFYKGIAVFTVAKGGLMADASVAGQKFSYKPAKIHQEAKAQEPGKTPPPSQH